MENVVKPIISLLVNIDCEIKIFKIIILRKEKIITLLNEFFIIYSTIASVSMDLSQAINYLTKTTSI